MERHIILVVGLNIRNQNRINLEEQQLALSAIAQDVELLHVVRDKGSYLVASHHPAGQVITLVLDALLARKPDLKIRGAALVSPTVLTKALSLLARTLFTRYGNDFTLKDVGSDEKPVAIKVLSADAVSADKRRRFKNEIAFLVKTRHPNIVEFLDHGVELSSGGSRPFYVMRRYTGSLRQFVGSDMPPKQRFQLFCQLLDGVEAAHLQGAIHRDLKPANVLFDGASTSVAVADFGIAQFTDDLLVTLVETQAHQRLANFQYAAPEQRTRGARVGPQADIYALGLMLNELFTGIVPHGTQYKQIGSVAVEYGFLDSIVAEMLRQNPSERPNSIAVLKGLI